MRAAGARADTWGVLLRAREEKAFGLIELMIAMVVLNVGILALVATFQSGAVSMNRSEYTANGTAVADKTMEVYRALENAAIYLNAPAGGGGDVSGFPNGFPKSTRPGTRPTTPTRRPRRRHLLRLHDAARTRRSG